MELILVSGNWGLSSVADPGEGPGGTASSLFFGGRPVPPPSGGSVMDPGEGPGGRLPLIFGGETSPPPPPPYLRVGMTT